MPNYLLVIQFDGINFSGWQEQSSGVRTVQGVLKKALQTLTKMSDLKITGSSRTDAHVSARRMPVTFKGPELPLKAYCHGLNTLLPADVKVLNAANAPDEFNARFFSTGKTYIYRILNTPVPMPIHSRHSYFEPRPLNVELMDEAAQYLFGEHDFSSFRAAADTSSHSFRYIRHIQVLKNSYWVELRITGNAFLTNMVRIIAGTLLQVGLGKYPPRHVFEVLQAKDRTLAGPTLPGHGLTLDQVFFSPQDFEKLTFLFNNPDLMPGSEVIWQPISDLSS